MSGVADRREAKRMEVQLPSVLLACLQTNRSWTRQVTVENVSTKGAFFHLEEAVPIDTSVELQIGLPSPLSPTPDLKLNLQGVVVRSDRVENGRRLWGIGIRFIGNWNVKPALVEL